MKIFTIHSLMFRLSDDFDGDLPSAVRAIATYLEQIRPSQDGCPGDNRRTADGEMTLRKLDGMLFDEFMEGCKTGKRLTGVMSFHEFNPHCGVKDCHD